MQQREMGSGLYPVFVVESLRLPFHGDGVSASCWLVHSCAGLPRRAQSFLVIDCSDLSDMNLDQSIDVTVSGKFQASQSRPNAHAIRAMILMQGTALFRRKSYR